MDTVKQSAPWRKLELLRRKELRMRADLAVIVAEKARLTKECSQWLAGPLGFDLTPTEMKVVEVMKEGNYFSKEIAVAVPCTVRAAKFHVANLMAKAGVGTRLALVDVIKGELGLLERKESQ